MKKYVYKSIKFTLPEHEIIAELVDTLKQERGDKVYFPGTVLEAVKFFKEHRNNPYITNPNKADDDVKNSKKT